jgi:hypothetical protein
MYIRRTYISRTFDQLLIMSRTCQWNYYVSILLTIFLPLAVQHWLLLLTIQSMVDRNPRTSNITAYIFLKRTIDSLFERAEFCQCSLYSCFISITYDILSKSHNDRNYSLQSTMNQRIYWTAVNRTFDFINAITV